MASRCMAAPVWRCARRVVFFCVVAGFLCGSAWGGPYGRTIEPGFKTYHSPIFRHQPKVHRYVEATDRLYRSHSVLAPATTERPGGDCAYYGNRLTQYRFGGDANEGGIYTAIEHHRHAN